MIIETTLGELLEYGEVPDEIDVVFKHHVSHQAQSRRILIMSAPGVYWNVLSIYPSDGYIVLDIQRDTDAQ